MFSDAYYMQFDSFGSIFYEFFEFLTTARHDETCLCSNKEFKFVKRVGE
jgi:hypothetical protein